MLRVTSFRPNEQETKTCRQFRPPADLPARGEERTLRAAGRVREGFAAKARTTVLLLITTTLFAASHPHLGAQEVTTQATPAEAAPSADSTSLPDEPGSAQYPVAKVLPAPDDTTAVDLESDTQSKRGSVYILDGDVVIHYRDRTVQADHIEYDTDTGELTATGHLHASGGRNHEDITASHGTMNLVKQTGTFYDVTGSVGFKTPGHPLIYANSNPFLFTGRMVVRTGPQAYEIYGGTLTSCQLPNPDWMLYADKFTVDSEKAKAQNSVFKLRNIPVAFLPYVTHPVDPEGRQTGFMIPVPGYSSTKGFTLGEEFYWVINRSADLTVGAQYYSLRGWEQSALFRFHGLRDDFAKARYSGLIDRGITTDGVYLNQGGEDVTFTGRHDAGANTRFVADAEYLSSYAYREAFAESFSLAVSSDILSILYGIHQANGYTEDIRVDRYQGLKMGFVPAIPATPTSPAVPATPEEQVRIFHAPSLDFDSTEHALGRSGLVWSFASSEAGLSRSQPDFSTGGLTQRIDLHPELAYPMHFDGWSVRPAIAARETIYGRSQLPDRSTGGPPTELPNALNRADGEASVDLRPPVVERTFDSAWVEKLFRHDLRHTIEPELTYRYVGGINNFLKVLRFDDVDIASDTNELEYGMTQRLFLRPLQQQGCQEPVPANAGSNPNLEPDQTQVSGLTMERTADTSGEDGKKPVCGSREWISWKLAQKHFYNQDFGGAVVDQRRNIFDTTLDFSGIAFLTEPRAISPLISRLRVRTSAHLDTEWDFDFDTGAKKFTSNNVFLDVHENNIFGGLSYARLNAPGRFYTEGVNSYISNFSQLRMLLGYGSPTKAGLGVAANVGLDLNATDSGLVQYGALQGSYNWDCCGFSVEVRKYELGAVRNETSERFNFTLLNIGTAGNLRRAASLF